MIARYTAAWFGMMILAVVNGAIRDFGYKPFTGDLLAHQISTVSLILVFAAYFWLLTSRWRLPSARQAWTVGAIWFILTEGFEFGLGLARGDSWETMLYAYDLSQGQVWILIPLWVLVGPYLFFRSPGF